MSQSDKRQLRVDAPSADVHSASTPESTALANSELSAALFTPAADAHTDLVGGSAQLASEGVDLAPALASQALRRRAMRHGQVVYGGLDTALRRTGSAMPGDLRQRMEASFGHGFGHVRLHTDAAAQQAAVELNAHAFAIGSDIYFGPGEYRPGSADTDRLLAHELTHVVQHDEGRIHGEGVSSPSDPLEREAYGNEGTILSRLDTLDRGGSVGGGVSLALGPVPDGLLGAALAGSTAESAVQEQMGAEADQLGAAAWGLDAPAMRDTKGESGGPPPGPESGPKAFKVGQEVRALVDGRGRMGVVMEVREWADSDKETLGESTDGWVYVVAFEREESTTVNDFLAEDMREAPPQPVPSATLPEEEVCEEEEPAPENEEETPTAVANAAEQPEQSNANGSPTEGPQTPAEGPVQGPALPPSGPAVFGPQPPPGMVNDLVQVSPGIPQGASPDLLRTHQDLTQSLNDRLGQQHSVFTGLQSDVQSQSSQMFSDFSSTAQNQRTFFFQTNQSVLLQSGQRVDGLLTQTVGVYDTFATQLDQCSTQTQTQLQATATATEQSLITSREQFPELISRAVDAERILMEAEFGPVIAEIEKQSADEKKSAEAEAQSHSGGIAVAEAVAGKLSTSKVKERYAKALRTYLDALYADLDSKKSLAAEEWGQSLFAPTIEQVWPATQQHAQVVKEKADRDKAEATRAKTKWSTEISNEKVKTEAEVSAAETDLVCQQDEAMSTLHDQADQSVQTLQSTQEDAATTLSTRQEDEATALDEAGKTTAGMDTSSWDSWALAYKVRSSQEHAQALAAAEQHTGEQMSLVDDQLSTAEEAVCQDTQNVQQSIETHQTNFTTAVQTSAGEQVSTLQSQGQALVAQHVQAQQDAQTQAEQRIGQVAGEAQGFLENTLRPVLTNYTASAKIQLSQLTTKMDAAIKGADAAGRAAEKKDRKKRSADVWAAADYTWGTDEAKMMSAVSGTTPVQASALRAEYASHHPHSLAWIIKDETSGNLKKSLLAWAMGDEVAAAKYAAKYGANNWFADADVIDSAVRGVSDEGRKKLAVDAEFKQDAADASSAWYREHDREQSLSALLDMSLTKDEAELQADAALLFQTMDTWQGTDENGAYAILEKYGPEKSAELRAAYAEYSYDRMNGAGAYDRLSTERKAELNDATLSNHIETAGGGGDFSGSEADRALALAWGNMGAARAAQLKRSSEWSNDNETALSAINDGKMYNGDDWLAGVEATQDHANFLEMMGRYEDGKGVSLADIKHQNTREGQQQAVDGWDANEAKTQQWIGDEFWGANTMDSMLQDKLLTGQASEADLMAFGVDCNGTRENFVKMSLEQIKGEKEYYVRLERLVSLGAYAKSFWTEDSRLRSDINRNSYLREARTRLANLPSYLSTLSGDTQTQLTDAIFYIMVVLAWETSGGDQFDMEILLAESLQRDDNVTDAWQVADQKFKNMLPEYMRSRAKNNRWLQEWLGKSDADRQQDLQDERERWEKGQEESDAGQVRDTSLTLAAHIVALENAYKDGAAQGHFDQATGFLYDHASDAKDKATNDWWTAFKSRCDHVDLAATQEEANQNKIVAIATTIVSAIAGVIIAVISAGSATALSAALWSAAVTLAAGLINITINFAVKGARYGADQLALDFATMITDAAMQFATLGMSKMAKLGPFLKAAGESNKVHLKLLAGAITSIPGELKGLLFNEDVLRGDKIDEALKQFFVGVAKSTTTGYVADYGKGKVQPFADTKGLAGQYLNQAIDEFVGIAGDAVTNPASLEDPAYWINKASSAIIGPAGAHQMQKHAVGLMNTKGFHELSLEHLGRLPPYMLGELSVEHRTAITTRFSGLSEGDAFYEQYKSLYEALETVGGVPEVKKPAPDDQQTEVDQEVTPIPEDGPIIKVEDSIPVSDVDAEGLPELAKKHPDDEVLDRLIAYANGGHGPALISDYVLDLPDAQAQLKALDILEQAYDLQMTKHVSQMDAGELDILVQNHMMHDQAFQQSLAVRKVFNPDHWEYAFQEGTAPKVFGSVGTMEGTENLSAEQKISMLGLDYPGSPYVEHDGRGMVARTELVYMDSPMTDELKQGLKIPVDQSIMDHALASNDPDVVLFAQTRYVVGAQDTQPLVDNAEMGKANPFTGNGATKPTHQFFEPFTLPNQEYFVADRSNGIGLAPGTQWFSLDANGNRVVVLTYNGPEAYQPFVMNPHLPDGPVKDKLLELVHKAKYQNGFDPFGGQYP